MFQRKNLRRLQLKHSYIHTLPYVRYIVILMVSVFYVKYREVTPPNGKPDQNAACRTRSGRTEQTRSISSEVVNSDREKRIELYAS